jgi:hypothetical protein
LVHQNQRVLEVHNILESSKDIKKNQIDIQNRHPTKLWQNLSRKIAATLKNPTPS